MRRQPLPDATQSKTEGGIRAAATPGTTFEVQTKQRASTAGSQKARQGRAPGSSKAHEWVPRPRDGGCPLWETPEGGAARPADRRGPEASPRRGTEANRPSAPTAAGSSQVHIRAAQPGPARPNNAWKGLSGRPPILRGGPGPTTGWGDVEPIAPDPPRQRRMEEPGAGADGGPGDGRGPPAHPSGTWPGRQDRPGRRQVPGRAGGGQGKDPGAALTFSVSRSLTVGSGVRVDILWAAAAPPRPAR